MGGGRRFEGGNGVEGYAIVECAAGFGVGRAGGGDGVGGRVP